MKYGVFLAFILLTQGLMVVFEVQSYLFSRPFDVFYTLLNEKSLFFTHSLTSLSQIAMGLGGGCLLSFLTAISLDKHQNIQKQALSVLALLKNMPIFVFAPLFFIWFGYGFTSKAILITLSCYFPMTMALLDGLNSEKEGVKELFLGLGSPCYRAMLFTIRLPHAMPRFFTGMKLAFLHAPVSVITCDWIGSTSGLGYLLMLSYGRMDLEFMFATLIILLFCGVFLYKIAIFTEKTTLKALNIT